MQNNQEAIDKIRYWHRQRCFAMEQRKRIDLALGSFLRLMHGWSKDKPDAERKRISDEVAALIAEPEDTEWAAIISASEAARAPFAAIEKRAVREMENLAGALPAWAGFGKDVRGFGAASLAVICGEAGDLSNYSTISKLWKRMGLAVFDGVRQGGLAKGAGAEAWVEHGYSPVRRSRMWNIGDALVKAQVRKVKDSDGEDTGGRVAIGYYGAEYLRQKAKYLAEREGITPMHAHRMAQRYMEKRLLKHLWQAWRRASLGVTVEPSFVALPADEITPQGVGEALVGVSGMASARLPPHQFMDAAE